MKVLELFSGTGSVGKVCRELGHEVISLDLKNADINCNILNWDYKIYPPHTFNIIWASPPCNTFSSLRNTHYGNILKNRSNNNVFSKEELYRDIEEIGLPILRRTEEIINYFQPQYYFIENPQTGKMKDYILDKLYYDVDYCRYSDWGYRKRTRIWTNLLNYKPLLCDNVCLNRTNNKHNKELSKDCRLNARYRIPPLLIKSLFLLCV